MGAVGTEPLSSAGRMATRLWWAPSNRGCQIQVGSVFNARESRYPNWALNAEQPAWWSFNRMEQAEG
ncbi:hypothetical protein BaRGS_00005786 [Batillaria attramentaria]|uniref:Uncharacterized protein n=1 Tax=Batillaria attramentaria TaxID=370345 RepID=A0ABD0LV90_9CAEN